MFQRLFHTDNDYTLAVLRVILGIVFFAHGAQKALGWFGGPGFNGTINFFQQVGIPAPLAVLAIAAEFLGGLGLLVGLLARVAALGIITNMVVAILMVHSQVGFFMNWPAIKKARDLSFTCLRSQSGWRFWLKGRGLFRLIGSWRTARRRSQLIPGVLRDRARAGTEQIEYEPTDACHFRRLCLSRAPGHLDYERMAQRAEEQRCVEVVRPEAAKAASAAAHEFS
jgi:putative oxidoreductase